MTWLWQPKSAYRSKFSTEHVNILRGMVARHYPDPHEFVCVTDIPKGLDSRIRHVPAWNDYADVPSPNGGHNPSCYRRLRAFSREVVEVFGERFVSLDLDTVIVGDLRPLWNRPDDFVIWGETNPKSFYNGSMWLMSTGARAKVWETFDPKTSPRQAYLAGKFGSDQGWISYCLGKGEKTWTTADGVYSYNVHLRGGRTTPPERVALPKDARVVMFHGGTDPWSHVGQSIGWVREHYRA